MATIYGIKNCDTMKKAFKWLDDHDVEYTFHDYKKSGTDETILSQAITEHGWETVINKRGTTWRQLSHVVQNNMDAGKAITIASENPSIVKRPLLLKNGKTFLGFKADQYEAIFNP